jgi:hypothetical protein
MAADAVENAIGPNPTALRSKKRTTTGCMRSSSDISCAGRLSGHDTDKLAPAASSAGTLLAPSRAQRPSGSFLNTAG